MEILKQKTEVLTQLGKKVPQIVQIREKTGIEEGLIILGFMVLSSLIILITMGGTILTVVLSVVYPAYRSIKALQTDDTEDDDKVWLTYWCVFGVFTLVDEFLGFIL